MKAATLSEIKAELKTLPPAQLVDICLQLAKFKKDNKELLTYLLFEAQDEASYVKSAKELISEQFGEINRSNIYYAKKTIRKILRNTTKFIKYSGSKQTETELLIFFCKKLKHSGITIQSSTALTNLYERQIFKIEKALSAMHEDLQFDYREELENLRM